MPDPGVLQWLWAGCWLVVGTLGGWYVRGWWLRASYRLHAERIETELQRSATELAMRQ